MTKVLSSNPAIVCAYSNILRNLALEYKNASNDKEKKEKALLVIIMSVIIVETFFNIYFYLLVSEERYSQHFDQISKEIEDTSYSLDKKIKNWPLLLFNKGIDLGFGVGQKFQNLKKLRNELLHFHSKHNEFEDNNFKLTKLLDITAYEKLSEYDVEGCITIVLDIASEMFRLVGIDENKIGNFIHLWFGDLSRRKT